MSLWIRALAYMFLFGGCWFVVLPAILLLLNGEFPLTLRSTGWLISGSALFLGGMLLSWYAAYHLVEYGHGTPFPLDPTRLLVSSGPYQYVRNPQAIATLLMTTGEVMTLRPLILLWLLPITLAYLEFLAEPYENHEMTRRYGKTYTKYRAQVPKWIPARQNSLRMDRRTT